MSPTGYGSAGPPATTWSSSRLTTARRVRASPGCGSCARATSRSLRDVGARLADQPVVGGKQAGQRPVGGARLGVDVLDVVAGGLARDDQALGDLPVGQAAGQQLEDLDLAAGQVGGPG